MPSKNILKQQSCPSLNQESYSRQILSIGAFDWRTGLALFGILAVSVAGFALSLTNVIEVPFSQVVANSVAVFAALFAFLSFRNSIRSRENAINPTLFLSHNQAGVLGVENLGQGPAHELSVCYCTNGSEERQWKDGIADCLESDLVVPTEEFVPIEDDFTPPAGDWKKLVFEFSYKTNSGANFDSIYRVVDRGAFPDSPDR